MLKVVTLGDSLLNRKSELITEITDEIVKLSKEMFEIMYYNNGIGLAAVQVGKLIRMFVTDVPDYGKYVMINPRIADKSLEKNVYEEGCISIPGIASEVERPALVSVEFTDIKGKIKRVEADELFAVCVQHEYDHLEGLLFIDRINPEDRLKKINEYNKLHIV